MKLDLLLADGQVAVIQFLRHGVESVVVVEVDERAFPVLQLIERRRLLKLATQIGELVIAPNLLKPSALPFFWSQV